MRHHLDRQAPLEERSLSKSWTVADSACDQRLVEALVLLAGERAVQIVALPVVDAAADFGHDGLPQDSARARVAGPAGLSAPLPLILRSHRDWRNTFVRSMVSASTIGLIAS